MTDFNPYAPPLSEVSAAGRNHTGESGYWADGTILVMSSDAQLPDRCVKCNLPTGGYRLKRRLYWHPSILYFLILLHILIYAIVATCVRKKATIEIGLCERHRVRRKRGIALAWLFSLLGIAVGVLGVVYSVSNVLLPLVIASSFALFVTGLAVAIRVSQVVVPKRIEGSLVWLKKIDPAFLAGLPAWIEPVGGMTGGRSPRGVESTTVGG